MINKTEAGSRFNGFWLPFIVWSIMNRLKNYFAAAVCLLLLFSCDEKNTEPVKQGRGIVSFAILKSDNPALSEDIRCQISEDGTINGTFNENMDDYILVPSFELDAEYLTSSSRLQLSGTTAQDFSKPVVYEAKMYDGTFRRYTVVMSFPVKKSLPVIKIETENGSQIKDKETYVKGRITISDPDGLYWDVPELVLEMNEKGIRGRGNTTWDMPKKPYKIKLDNKAGIFGLPADKEWVLLANYSDKTLLRNVVAMRLSEIVGMKWTPAMLPVEVYLNNDYIGCYTFSEHKKVAKHRIDLDIVTETDNSGDLLTGDYYFEIESRLDEATCFLTEVNHIPMMFKEPEMPTSEQLNYVKTYFRDAELALNGVDFKDIQKGWQKYIDAESFAKAFIVNELTKNIDGNMRKSSFITKQRGHKLEMYFLWDYDLALGNCDYMSSLSGGVATDGPEGWFVKTTSMDQGINWYIRMSEDPAFCSKVKEIWKSIYPELKAVPSFIDRQVWQIDEAQTHNFQRWDILGIYVWPNRVVTGNYSSEVAYMKEFYRKRLEWLDGKFNIPDGEIFR